MKKSNVELVKNTRNYKTYIMGKKSETIRDLAKTASTRTYVSRLVKFSDLTYRFVNNLRVCLKKNISIIEVFNEEEYGTKWHLIIMQKGKPAVEVIVDDYELPLVSTMTIYLFDSAFYPCSLMEHILRNRLGISKEFEGLFRVLEYVKLFYFDAPIKITFDGEYEHCILYASKIGKDDFIPIIIT